MEAPGNRRPLIVHASHLVPFETPYVEPEVVDVGEDARPLAEPRTAEDRPPESTSPRRLRKRHRTQANTLNVWEFAKFL